MKVKLGVCSPVCSLKYEKLLGEMGWTGSKEAGVSSSSSPEELAILIDLFINAAVNFSLRLKSSGNGRVEGKKGVVEERKKETADDHECEGEGDSN